MSENLFTSPLFFLFSDAAKSHFEISIYYRDSGGSSQTSQHCQEAFGVAIQGVQLEAKSLLVFIAKLIIGHLCSGQKFGIAG